MALVMAAQASMESCRASSPHVPIPRTYSLTDPFGNSFSQQGRNGKPAARTKGSVSGKHMILFRGCVIEACGPDTHWIEVSGHWNEINAIFWPVM
jgi:hypothetical protein